MKTTAIITMSFLTVFFLGCKDDRAINLYPMEPVSGYEIIYKPNEINIVESINDKHDTLKMYKHNKEYYLKENNRNRLCMSVLRDSGEFMDHDLYVRKMNDSLYQSFIWKRNLYVVYDRFYQIRFIKKQTYSVKYTIR